MDEIYVWNRTITDSERNDLYNNGSGLFYPGYIVYPPSSLYGTKLSDCKYKQFGYYNLKLVWARGVSCA